MCTLTGADGPLLQPRFDSAPAEGGSALWGSCVSICLSCGLGACPQVQGLGVRWSVNNQFVLEDTGADEMISDTSSILNVQWNSSQPFKHPGPKAQPIIILSGDART